MPPPIVIFITGMPLLKCNMSGTRIQEYIEANPGCKLPKTVSTMLQGQRKDLLVYRLPLEMTFYSIKNGRFAAEYGEKTKKMGRELDPTNPRDSDEIRELLTGIDPNQSNILQKDMLKNGQREPGIITHDGFVINGNRRRSVLEELVLAGQSQFAFIDVGILPPNVSAKDLWMIEAGIQMARNVQLDYNPINELLKFKEGLDAGLSPIQIAEAIYGGYKASDIVEKLEQYKLISQYLNFIQEPGNFMKARRIHEHFIDLRKIRDTFGKVTGATPDEKASATRIAFQLIHDGVQAREFRKLKDILVKDEVRKELWDAREHSKPEPSSEKMKKKRDAEEKDGHTEARTIFNNCVDSLNALKDAENPEKLLGRALKNLDAIDINHANLKQPEIVEMINKATNILNTLKHKSTIQK